MTLARGSSHTLSSKQRAMQNQLQQLQQQQMQMQQQKLQPLKWQPRQRPLPQQLQSQMRLRLLQRLLLPPHAHPNVPGAGCKRGRSPRVAQRGMPMGGPASSREEEGDKA